MRQGTSAVFSLAVRSERRKHNILLTAQQEQGYSPITVHWEYTAEIKIYLHNTKVIEEAYHVCRLEAFNVHVSE